jgi:Transposase and inactivated derivatives
MEWLYEAAGLSRQAFHQWLGRGAAECRRTPQHLVLEMARDVREGHLPGMSARELYCYIRKRHEGYSSALLGWGKHRFEAFCLANGFRVEHRRFVPKTTVRGDHVFPNRIEGMEISDIDQVWVSDICYLFDSHGKLIGYATSLIDLYSRLLLGLSFSQSMRAEETSSAVLAQAFEARKKQTFDGLTFHSDGGKQYIEANFVRVLRGRGIQSSMAETCYENAFAEAFNDTLKNHMLSDSALNSFEQLKRREEFLKYCYNHNKPHSGLNRMTPVEFERNLLSVKHCQRTLLEIKKIEPRPVETNHLLSLTPS